MKKILIFLGLTGLLLATAGKVGAQECSQTYGGTVCNYDKIWVDKKVRNPQTGSWDDHLLPENPYYAGEEVRFTLKVTNNDPDTIPVLRVVDWLPAELDFVSASDGGSWDSNTREINWEIHDLAGYASKTLELTGKVRVEALTGLTSDDVTNKFQGRVDTENDEDYSLFYIRTGQRAGQAMTKGGFITYMPETGPMDWVLALGGSGGLLGIGLGFIKKARRI